MAQQPLRCTGRRSKVSGAPRTGHQPSRAVSQVGHLSEHPGPRRRVSGGGTFEEMSVDVVIVSFNSREKLRACVEPLAGLDGVSVAVVDNASPDRSLEVVADLPVRSIPLTSNAGFAHGCNVGARAGSAPYVLLLNPDTTIEVGALRRLVSVLESNPRAGAVAPRIVSPTGELHHSLRRFPRLRSTYSQAFFLHRFFPRALWADEMIRRDEEYARPGVHEWVSGACILLRRSLLEQLNGLDDGFFLYCEDTDLCLQDPRIRSRGALRTDRCDRPRGWCVGLSFEPPSRGSCEPHPLRPQAPEPHRGPAGARRDRAGCFHAHARRSRRRGGQGRACRVTPPGRIPGSRERLAGWLGGPSSRTNLRF